MVKPPKKWLQEYAANQSKYSCSNAKPTIGKKRGRGSFGTNMDNTFRNYMARKISVQREQFGLVLPPTPPDLLRRQHGKKSKVTTVAAASDESWKRREMILAKDHLEKEKIKKHITFEEEQTLKKKRLQDSRKKKLVHFNDSNIGEYPTTISMEDHKKVTKDSKFSEVNSMEGVLNRLKQKHGSCSKRKRKRNSKCRERKSEREVRRHLREKNFEEKEEETLAIKMKINLGQKYEIGKNEIKMGVVENNQCEHIQMERSSSSHSRLSASPPNSLETNIAASIMCESDQEKKNETESQSVIDVDSESSQSKSNTSTHQELRRKRPDLFFLGITVMVNGYTNPCSDTIMRTLHKYGGNLEKYETEQVTHIIAENLSTAKANIYKKQKKPIPVVKPKWILDCVEASKLLPYQDYLLDEVKDDILGKVLSVKSYFKATRGEDTKEEAIKDSNSSKNLASVSSPVSKKKSFSGPRNVGNDPNFLESYFASSRLSFIGTYKQRMKKTSANDGSHKYRKEGSQCFVFHIDMDCFFAAIAVRNYPQYKDKPVAVGHGWRSDPNGVLNNDSSVPKKFNENKYSTCELSTCNYAARKFGVQKGMFAHRARKLCPELVILPYDYEGYNDASCKVAEILNQYADSYHGVIEQVSCDESYLEIHLHEDDDAINSDVCDVVNKLGYKMNKEILDATCCTVSIGIGSNKLMAKLATDKVKNIGGNGVHLIADSKAFLSEVKLRDLPGIGYRLEKKLQSHNLLYVRDVWAMENESELCSILGKGNGRKIYMYCQGIDSRPVKVSERKTIGAECNYGVRFEGPYGVEHMMAGLAKEVVKRMTAVGVLGKYITVKVKERQDNAPAPGKFNGHGKCNDHSKSCIIPVQAATRDAELFCREGMKLFVEIGVSKEKVRGMGIIISKLENDYGQKQLGSDQANMDVWLQKVSTTNLPKDEPPNKNLVIDLFTPENDTNDEIKSCDENLVTRLDSEFLVESSEAFINDGRDNRTYHEVEMELSNITSPDNIVLPPLEEISMSDVMALPLDLRENILTSIRAKQNSLTKSKNIQTRSKQRASHKYRHRKIFKQQNTRPKVTKIDHQLPGQVNLKRMMKLVSVKSGQDKLNYDGEQVSLTQLEYLPLDIQLQVANSDDSMIKKKSIPLPASDSSKVQKPFFHSPIEIHNDQEIYTDINDATSTSEHVEVMQVTFERENEESDIRLLSDWLDEKVEPKDEDFIKLKEYLCICISEMRVDDAVTFLRLVKRKSSFWTVDQYERLLEECNNHLLKYQGRNFDFCGLGLSLT